MIKKIFRHFRLKRMAGQLRKPSGKNGTAIGIIMNNANELQYDFTIDCMQICDRQVILEIGFANGNFLKKVFSKANGLQVTGLDYSRKMVAEATFINQQLIDNGQLTLIEANSNSMPFPDNSFDKIFCINVVYFWENPLEHLKEINRVLKPGGRFFTTIRNKESMKNMAFTKFRFTLYSAAEWKDILKNSGFRFNKFSELKEPDFVFNGSPHNVSSLCFEVQK